MNEERLRDVFGELRRSEAARAPRFERIWNRQAIVPHPRRFSLAFALTLVLLLTMVTITIVRKPAPAPGISEWRAPTDFLLDTPGRELLNTLPDLKGNQQ